MMVLKNEKIYNKKQMALFNDRYCQTCDRFITEDKRNKHLYSSRPLRREVDGYEPAFFKQRKLNRDESSTLEKTFLGDDFRK